MVQDSIVDERRARIERAYREQSQKLWRALFAHTGDPEIASDALAEAFARALRHEGAIRDVPVWTWRVAFRVATRELRRQRVASLTSDPVAYGMPAPIPELVSALRALHRTNA